MAGWTPSVAWFRKADMNQRSAQAIARQADQLRTRLEAMSRDEALVLAYEYKAAVSALYQLDRVLQTLFALKRKKS